jgi:hypothetical protein
MVRTSPAVFALLVLLAAAPWLAQPVAAQGGPNALPLPNPSLDNLPQQQQGISLGGGVTLAPGVGIQGGFTQDSLQPAPTQDSSSQADMGSPALGAGEDTDMGASGATITIPLD